MTNNSMKSQQPEHIRDFIDKYAPMRKEPAVAKKKIELRSNGDGTYIGTDGHSYERDENGKVRRLPDPEPVVNKFGELVLPRMGGKKKSAPAPRIDVNFSKNAMQLDKGRFVIPIPKKFAPYIKARISTTGRVGRQVFLRFPNGHGASIVHTSQSKGVEVKPVTWNHHLTKNDELKSFSYFSDKWDGYEQIRISVGGLRVAFGQVIGNATKEEIVQTLEAIEALPVLLDGEDYEGSATTKVFKIERYLLTS